MATWNVAFIDRSADELDLDGYAEEVDFDILIVNEIKQNADLNDLKAAMGKENFFTAISSIDVGNRGLEVGIISRFPLTDIVEFDRSLDNSGGVDERKLERVDIRGIANVGVGRGFLVAKIPQLQLFVVATHLKSSRGRSGDSDRNNAQKRELVAAAISEEVLQLRENNPDYSVIFGGDINVGVTDSNKNGVILDNDTTDGYDDTHAILELGLINGLKMKSLAKNVDGTFVGNGNSPLFPGTGAIDVLYVVGPLSDSFGEAQATSSSFGSDHLGVFASIGNVDTISDDDSGNVTGTAPDGILIINALPNPVSSDSGRETVTISNDSGDIVDISGWKLRDEANNNYVFPSGTMLIERDNELTLIRNTMPLNNSGDRVVLLDDSGNQIGAEFVYSENEVVVGLHVR
ncbi:MAG: lamin tail domain-containing protein [Cyanobacteria bacterium P01_A01_bin.40]